MKKTLLAGLAMGFLVIAGTVGVAGASTVVVNFDDLATNLTFNAGGSVGTVNYGIVPTTYAGLDWTGWEFIPQSDVNKYLGNSIAFPTSPNAGYPGNGQVSTTSGQLFDFAGAYLASFVGGNGAGNSLTVTGYLSNEVKLSRTVDLTSTMIWTDISITGIDKLDFSSNGYYLLDNFTYDKVAPVPIPGAAWLLGSGLIGLVGLSRKKKAAVA